MTKSLVLPLGLVAMLAVPVEAQVVATTSTPSPLPAFELQAVQRAIDRSEDRQKALEGEIASLTHENDELSRRLIDTAAMIQAREALITAAEERIATLGSEEAAIKAGLLARNDQLAHLLSGLIQLEENPPPALVAKPHDALEAVRAAMLFGTAVPAVRTEAANLGRDLARLQKLRTSIAYEKEGLTSHLEKLRGSSLQLGTLIERKKSLLASTGDRLKQEKETANRLAKKAKSLSQLLAALAAEARKREAKEAEAAQLAPPPAEALEKPKLPFTEGFGKLEYPAQGQVVRRFGDSDGFGGLTKGLYIATRPSAQVIAPWSARVEFAGTFRSYGQLLILDVGEGYHVLLAGLARVDVETGQTVRAGEPVGGMGDTPARGTMIGDQLSEPRPIVYVEFRKAGDAVDPSAWWIGGSKEARK